MMNKNDTPTSKDLQPNETTPLARGQIPSTSKESQPLPLPKTETLPQTLPNVINFNDSSKKSAYTFDPNATEYSLDNAGFLLDACSVSYEDEGKCRKWAENNNFIESFNYIDTSIQNPINGTQCFVVQNPQAILIVFRGTDKTKFNDYLTNLQGAQKKTWNPLGAIHEGFYDAFFTVWGKFFGKTRIFPDLLKQNNRKLWITGHSLGGALAQICAAQSELHDAIPVHSVYTYGQPRVGDKKFADVMYEKMGSRVFRVVNNKDIIPKVAPFTLGYRHFGKEYYYDKDGKLTIIDTSVEDDTDVATSLKNSIPNMFTVNGVFSIGNNLIQKLNFIENIEQSINLTELMNNQKQQILDHFILNGYMPKLFKSKN